MDVIISEASSKNPDTEGVARIDGLVVFVDGATTIGDRVNIRITGRRERMAFAETTGKPAGEAKLVSSTSSRKPRSRFTPTAGDSAAHVIEGAEMDVVISEKSSKNPGTEGVARVNGLVVFVDGATQMGERVNIRITGRRERMAFAELTGNPAGTSPLPKSTAQRKSFRSPRQAFVPKAGDVNAAIVPGVVIATTILEPSTKNPDTEGVAKVNGMVVFVKGATTPGQAVNVLITRRSERVASGEVTTEPTTAVEPKEEAAPASPDVPAS